MGYAWGGQSGLSTDFGIYFLECGMRGNISAEDVLSHWLWVVGNRGVPAGGKTG